MTHYFTCETCRVSLSKSAAVIVGSRVFCASHAVKTQTWECANGCGSWTTEVPLCFQYNGAEVLCVFCLVKQNSHKVFAALAQG